ncbi:MAG: Pyruvoyl-dependent arginine decarboxylase [Parcubacteria bacterium C7867-008]|nr:MAG: Pyruvoyl-dependent arginine decarboxylase [Parcubacteria bacterium C7867-008]
MKKNIKISTGTGTGTTRMAAFDAALFDAGVANYNLIRLSSIIPTGFTVETGKAELEEGEFGHKLYVVYASQIEDEVGKDAWAGIGWTKMEDGSGRGLFTEHEGHSEHEVTALITNTLTDMKKYRSEKYGDVGHVTTGISCTDKPVCALVIAVYESEGWD